MHADTSAVIRAFLDRTAAAPIARTATDGTHLTLWGHPIAEHRPDGLWITLAGWPTKLTMDRLSQLPGVTVNPIRHLVHLNGVPWDGAWVRVRSACGRSLKIRPTVPADVILGWSGRLAKQGAPRGYECGPAYRQRLAAMYGRKTT